MSGGERKTHYQASFTGTQALVAICFILLALSVSFFFGVKAGLSRAPENLATPAGSSDVREAPPVSVEIAPAPSGTSASAISASPSSGSSVTAAAAPPAPIVADTFEDREAGVPEAATSSSSPKTVSHVDVAPTASVAPKTEVKSPEPAESKTAPPKSAGFYVQVISTVSKAEAGKWKTKLSSHKYRASVSSVDSKKGTLYRVRVGPFNDKDQAQKIAKKISAEEKRQAWVAPAE